MTNIDYTTIFESCWAATNSLYIPASLVPRPVSLSVARRMLSLCNRKWWGLAGNKAGTFVVVYSLHKDLSKDQCPLLLLGCIQD